jgi:hypothetical protein
VFLEEGGEAVGVNGVQSPVLDHDGSGIECRGDERGKGVRADRGGEERVGDDAAVAGERVP